MAEDTPGPAAPQPPGSTDADAAAIALALGSAGRERADEYLARQSRLADLRIEYVAEQDKFELSHLRYREWSDVARFTLQAAAGIIALLLLFGIGATLWTASHADGLVIEAFASPPDLAHKGLTGPVLAAKLLDKLTAMQKKTNSVRAASSFENDWTSDIKVDIPDTGVSLGEVIAYLNDRLGRQQHLTGELVETPDGVALTVRLGGEPGETFKGKLADIDALMQKAAEAVYRRAQPYRFVTYLFRSARPGEAIPVLRHLALTGDRTDRAWALGGLALYLTQTGHPREALQTARRSLALAPNFPLAYLEIAGEYAREGRQEKQLAALRAAVSRINTNAGTSFEPRFLPVMRDQYQATIDELLGDYTAALRRYAALTALPDYRHSVTRAIFWAAIDHALDHDGAAAAVDLAEVGPASPDGDAARAALARAYRALDRADWQGVIRQMTAADRALTATVKAGLPQADTRYYHRVVSGPYIALAYARLGEQQAADAALKDLPADCDLCSRMRGNIAAIRGRTGAAAYWFARAVRQAPSLPFADTDWGRMLLAKGDYDGAIARFTKAHDKGPHFADPLEGWGEALIAKNRSDLARAKFKEANRYAPHWGRLHLKWGEALIWSGDKTGAQKQFALAATLDLTPAERTELHRFGA